jgi:hypothetical protein
MPRRLPPDEAARRFVERYFALPADVRAEVMTLLMRDPRSPLTVLMVGLAAMVKAKKITLPTETNFNRDGEWAQLDREGVPHSDIARRYGLPDPKGKGRRKVGQAIRRWNRTYEVARQLFESWGQTPEVVQQVLESWGQTLDR